MLRLRDLTAETITTWAESLDWPFLLPRRAWKRFTDFHFERTGLFAQATGNGGFSGSAKLHAAYAHLLRLHQQDAAACREWAAAHTIGNCLDAAREAEEALGFLPPLNHAVAMSRMAGRPDVAERLQEVGL